MARVDGTQIAHALGLSDHADFVFTAMIELADTESGTRYTATVIHADEAGVKKHESMGAVYFLILLLYSMQNEIKALAAFSPNFRFMLPL
jgi:hypothetical protein